MKKKSVRTRQWPRPDWRLWPVISLKAAGEDAIWTHSTWHLVSWKMARGHRPVLFGREFFWREKKVVYHLSSADLRLLVKLNYKWRNRTAFLYITMKIMARSRNNFWFIYLFFISRLGIWARKKWRYSIFRK